MRTARTIAALCVLALLAAAPAHSEFAPATHDPVVGDWQGDGGLVAQVIATGGGYQASLLKAFDTADKPVALLSGKRDGDTVKFTGDGWAATLKASQFTGDKDAERFELRHVDRPSPTLGTAAPEGGVVLLDGKHLEAWTKKAGKDWLKDGGEPAWKLVDAGAVEVVPGSDSLISRQNFGDCRVHVEFRTLGAPTNSGVYLQARYEVNISETYGRTEGSPSGSLDNCTDKSTPRVRAARPPLAWQTLDIDFRAPRFDAAGAKTAPARATVRVNGVTLYNDQELSPPRGAAGRLGEAATGPILLQEHGAPLQFRNIWVVPAKG